MASTEVKHKAQKSTEKEHKAQNGKTRSRNWFLTLNNYTQEELDKLCQDLKDDDVVYYIMAKEVGESGTPHIQGEVRFKNPRQLSGMKKFSSRAHWEKTISPDDANKYCKKDGDYVEYGTPPKQGKRTDLDEVRDAIREGANMRDIILESENFQQIKMAEKLMPYLQPKRNWKPRVRWFHGPSGTGKTRKAVELFKDKDYYKISGANLKWWQGYYGQEYVIIDELRQRHIDYGKLLSLLDRYEETVDVKGTSSQFLAREIIITGPVHPEKEYDHFNGEDDSIEQLLRRLDEIVDFGKPLKNPYSDSYIAPEEVESRFKGISFDYTP